MNGLAFRRTLPQASHNVWLKWCRGSGLGNLHVGWGGEGWLSFGRGMVLLTPTREVLLVNGVHFPGVDDPMVVELLTLREAILWCLGHGFSAVRFEGDAQLVIEKIRRGKSADSRMGPILEEVSNLVVAHAGLSVRFVGRRNNRIAHLVARKTLSLYPTTSHFFDFQTWPWI
ncbi:unnamed protein product [Linum trigynum]|uniref:RNase H type-1 domain-containing protein n=1 Tax=Linum trigynum TaxID=586398 RepID=A0AAV2GCW8_9ROSI